MELWKYEVPAGSSQASTSVIKDERSRQPIHKQRISLSNRVRGTDCMLADIEAQIKRLRQERTYLRLVLEGLTDRLSGGSFHELDS